MKLALPMTIKSASKSSFRHWIHLALALIFLCSGMTASALGFVFSQHEWLNTAIYGAIISLNSLNLVLVIPQLLSLALCGQDIQKLTELASEGDASRQGKDAQ